MTMAGKTTLLNVLSNRVGGHVQGDVLINGHRVTKQYLRSHVGYVHQQVCGALSDS